MSWHKPDAPLVVATTRPSLARNAGRMVANAVIVVLGFGSILWCVILILLEPIFLGQGSHEAYTLVGASVAVTLIAPALVYWGLGAARRARARRRLRHGLHARLAAAGLALDAASPDAQALRAAFWSEAQQDALHALATRQATLDAPVDLLQIIEDSMHKSQSLILGVATLWALATLLLVASFLAMAGMGHALLAFSSALLASGLIFTICAVLFLSAAGAVQGVGRLIKRRELVQERRHVIALADLASAAGGLTLANDDDEALRGALSGDVASAGEIELVGRPTGEGEL
jgi:hypothetical protein